MECLYIFVILLGLITEVSCNCVVIRSKDESEWKNLTTVQPTVKCFQATSLGLEGLNTRQLCTSLANITTIDVSNNSLRNVTDFKCFVRVKHLNLSMNNIEHLQSGDFKEFGELKTVDLSWNGIKHISPKAFPWQNLQKLESINLTHNNLTELDSWYLMLNNNTFRYLNVSYNNIRTFSNSYKWDIKTSARSKEKQPKLCLDLSNNNVSQITYETILLFKIQELFTEYYSTMANIDLLDIDATFGNSIQTLFIGHKWKCDCDMYLLYHLFWEAMCTYLRGTLTEAECVPLWGSKEITGFEYGKCQSNALCQNHSGKKELDLLACLLNYMTSIVCNNTSEQLEGKPLVNLNRSELYATCTVRKNCPDACSCIKDYKNTTITSVNCTGQHLTDLPHQMPSGNLKLYMDKNEIKELQQSRNYWKQVIVLDISFNNISQMSHSVFDNMTNLRELYLHNNKIKEINKKIRDVLQERKLIQKTLNTIQIHENPLQCDCSLQRWLKNLKFAKTYFANVTCGFTGLQSLMDYDCIIDVTGIIIGTTCGIVIAAVLLFVSYRYRQQITIVLYNRIGIHFGHMLEEVHEYENNDAFVFYHSDIDDQRKFVTDKLCADLENDIIAYKLIVPDRDFELGISFQENINVAIKKSRRCILIVSRQFIKSKTCMGVFKLAHEKNSNRKGRYLVIVKYNQIYRNDYIDSALLAESNVLYSQYMHLGCFIDIASKQFTKTLKYMMPKAKKERDREMEG